MVRDMLPLASCSIGTKVVTLVLASDRQLIAAGIRTILSGVPDVLMVGEAQCVKEVEELVGKLQPRILLVDMELAGQLLAVVGKKKHGNFINTITIVLVDHECDAFLTNMINEGAAGVISLSTSTRCLVDTIHKAACGGTLFTSEQYSRAHYWHENVIEKWHSLTTRERQILRMLALGVSTLDVAGVLGIKAKTVDFHVTNILQKLAANSRLEAVVWIYKNLPDNLEESSV
jgi:DNA-binding NarL/FixJ family response regulator